MAEAHFREWFSHPETAGRFNLQLPLPELDWSMEFTLSGTGTKEGLLMIENDGEKTTHMHLDAYAAREIAAVLIGYADAVEGYR